MIVICAGMYRSALTWQYNVACRLVERDPKTSPLGFVFGEESAALERLALDDSWHVLKTHDAHPRLAELLRAGRAALLYIYRDLRDVTCSLAHVESSTIEHLCEGSDWLDRIHANDRFWRSQPHALCQRYEEVVADYRRGTAEIAHHLGLDLPADQAAALGDALSLEASREITSVLPPGGVDPRTLLHWNHVRAGKIGAWRDQATPRQIALLGLHRSDWLIANGYEIDDSWAADAVSQYLPEICRSALRRAAYTRAERDSALNQLEATKKRLSSVVVDDGIAATPQPEANRSRTLRLIQATRSLLSLRSIRS